MRLLANIYATAVAINGGAVLITGASGSGKSDLALRLIDRDADLIADDRTEIYEYQNFPYARPPAKIAGLIEVRDLGVVRQPFVTDLPVRLIVELDQPRIRCPEQLQVAEICGFKIPSIRLDATEASAPIKVERALLLVVHGGHSPLLAAQTEGIS